MNSSCDPAKVGYINAGVNTIINTVSQIFHTCLKPFIYLYNYFNRNNILTKEEEKICVANYAQHIQKTRFGYTQFNYLYSDIQNKLNITKLSQEYIDVDLIDYLNELASNLN